MPAAAPAPTTTPPPLDWASFTINPDSCYADDDQEAATLAEQSARELAGYLFSARILEIARSEGRNPLVVNARPFTGQQFKKLEEAIREARNMADWMLEECARAFGDEAAGRIREYVGRRLDAEINYTPEPRQQDLF